MAYYVPSANDARQAQLREGVGRLLPAYMVPSAFVALDSLPRTPNGKLDRASLPALDGGALDGDHVAPRDSLEQELVALWEEILGTREMGVRDDFFLVGGHSLLAVRLLARVERTYGINLPLATLLERPTVEALAEQIRAGRSNAAVGDGETSPSLAVAEFTHLVAIQTGRQPPLVCVHGAGGNVLNMRGIARSVDRDCAFLAFQGRGIDGRERPFERIEQMATAYVAELLKAQPHGPYFLSGYCGGGLVAFEMARMLQDQNEPVALLALIDTYRPGAIGSKGLLRRVIGGVRKHGPGFVPTRAGIWASREAGGTVRCVRIGINQWRGQAVPHEHRDYWLTEAFFRAAAMYRPGVYNGRITVLRAVEVHPLLAGVARDLGWGEYATGGVDVCDIPGSHDTITSDPNLAALGATLRECMVAAGCGGWGP